MKADRAKGETGAYRLESEGLDNDGDGAINEDPPGGVDFDRNFPHGWKEFDRRAGTSACSEVETRGADRPRARDPHRRRPSSCSATATRSSRRRPR